MQSEAFSNHSVQICLKGFTCNGNLKVVLFSLRCLQLIQTQHFFAFKCFTVKDFQEYLPAPSESTLCAILHLLLVFKGNEA